MVSPQKQRFESLQVLRGISALAVLLYHSHELGTSTLGAPPGFWNFFTFGHSGVDVFFVLSGFIMYYVHENDLGKSSRLKPFVLKRGIRIYPIYWILTLAVLPAFYLAPESIKAYKHHPGFILQCLALYPVNGLPIIPPAWSLSHELKFYGFFALAICLPTRFSRWLFGFMIALSLAVYSLQLLPGTHALVDALSGNHFLFFLIYPYNLEFAAGSLCAFILKRYSPSKPIVIFAPGIFLFSVTAIVDNRGLMSEDWRILCYGVPSALLVLGTAACNFQSRSPVFRSLVFLGEASYSLYLIHYPACTIACILLLKFGMVHAAGVTIATLLMVCFAVFSGCSFHWLVEKPILKAARRRLLKQEKEF